MDIRVVVGLNLQRLRRERGLSQEELSFRSGFTRAYLSGIETGRRNPTILSLAKLAQALDTDAIELLAPPVRGKPSRTIRQNKAKPAERVKSGSKAI